MAFSAQAEEVRGGLMAAAAPHREQRTALSSALCDSDWTRGNGMELCQGRGSWGLGKGSAPKGTERAAQGSRHGPSAGVQGVFVHHSQAQGLILGGAV